MTDEAGRLGSTPSTTPTQRNAQNTNDTPTQRDNSALIDALTKRMDFFQTRSDWFSTERCQYVDAIKSVKAGGRVDFGRLPTPSFIFEKFPPLPRELCDAYNTFHGY